MVRSRLHARVPALQRVCVGAAIPAVLLVFASLNAAGTAGAAEGGASQSNFATRCQECHSVDAVLSHPVDVRPRMSTPANLPLTDGKITCTTCHEATPHSDASAGTMLRAGAESGNLCSQCHTDRESAKIKGHVSLGKAHLQGATGRRAATAESRRENETTSCMGCHDGAMAPDAGGHSLRMPGSSDGGADHPVAVAYKTARAQEVRLVETPKLDRRIRLFNQSIGCGSCHSVYSTQKQELVMSNLGSKLCLGCHVQ